MRSLKFRVYPAKPLRAVLEDQLELCRWLYNRLLAELQRARTEGRTIKQGKTQALIVHLKKAEKPELTHVYSKVLQMVNYQLWANLRGLAALKAQERRLGNYGSKERGGSKLCTSIRVASRLTWRGSDSTCPRSARFLPNTIGLLPGASRG